MPSYTARDFICGGESRSDDEDFFRGPARFQPILAARNSVIARSRCDDGDAHFESLHSEGEGESLRTGSSE